MDDSHNRGCGIVGPRPSRVKALYREVGQLTHQRPRAPTGQFTARGDLGPTRFPPARPRVEPAR